MAFGHNFIAATEAMQASVKRGDAGGTDISLRISSLDFSWLSWWKIRRFWPLCEEHLLISVVIFENRF